MTSGSTNVVSVRGKEKLRGIAKDLAHLPAPAGRARSLVVLGCQRSGTNALIACFERDRHAKVFREYASLNQSSGAASLRDSVRYSLRLRPLGQVAERLEHLRYPLAVMKPLVESQRAVTLLRELPRSRVIWLFRHYEDVAESNARTFGATIHRRNLEPIAAGDPTDWRSEGAGEEVRSFVGRHYRVDMDPVEGGALFWWARNRLLFDQGLPGDPRVKPLRYERLVADPISTLRELYEYAGVPFPGPAVAAGITPRFSGRASGLHLSEPVREACERLQAELVAADREASEPARGAS